jgi:hypothetical protein
MSVKTAKADVAPVRQRTQYTCMSTSMMMCLKALGHDLTEDEVNRVMGARAMKGASWEQALACAQHYGCRATLTMPSTVKQLKAWTDKGTPVMIAWNPEGRDWSHASTVFDVTESLPNPLPADATIIGDRTDKSTRWVWVADPNLPNPEKTHRIVSEDEFYGKWYEKWPDYLVRRPACAIEREITADGKQRMASTKKVAYEVFVDQEGWASDDEGNRWFVGPEYAGTYGSRDMHKLPKRRRDQYPSRPRSTSPKVEQTDADRRNINRALVAIKTSTNPDYKAIKFLSSIAYKTEITEKQKSWRDRLFKQNARVMNDQPRDLIKWFTAGFSGMPEYYGNASKPDHVAYVEKYHESWREESGGIRPGPARKAPARPAPAPSAPAADKAKQLEALDALLAANPNNFIQSLRDQVARGRTLSEKQRSALRQNFYRNRMRDMADLFRTAGMPFGYPATPRPAPPVKLSMGWREGRPQRNGLRTWTLDFEGLYFRIYEFDDGDPSDVLTRGYLYGLRVQDPDGQAWIYKGRVKHFNTAIKLAEDVTVWWRKGPDSMADVFPAKMFEKTYKMARTLRDRDGREWGPKHGLEGPTLHKGGRVLYYDPKERGGSYYDPTTDMYLSQGEADRLASWRVAAMHRARTQKTAEPRDCYRDGLRGRELADCIKQFPDDLGSRDIALIQRFYPGWSPRGFSQPRRSGLDEAMRESIAKNLLAYGIRGSDKATRSIEFLKSVLKRNRALTPKQQDWFNKIDQSNERYTRQMPNGIQIATIYMGSIILFDPKKSTSGAKRWVEQHTWYVEDMSFWAIKGDAASGPKGESSQPDPTPAPESAPRPQRAPAPPKGVVDSAATEKVQILTQLEAKVRNWPDGLAHVQRVKAEYEAGREPAPDDLKRLRNILYRNRMKPLADHFRTARELREARAKKKKQPQSLKTRKKAPKKDDAPKPRSEMSRALAETGGKPTRTHKNRGRDEAQGRARRPKHKKDWRDRGAASGWHLDNPNWTETEQGLVAWLEQENGHSMNEAGEPKGALEMMAWDKGYQSDRLHANMSKLGKLLGVDVRKSYKEGQKAKAVDLAGPFGGKYATDETLINRAAQMLSYGLSERDIAKKLMDSGASSGDAFHAVKAAKILNTLQPPRRLNRQAPDGHYQIWFARYGERDPYITDAPSIQVAMRKAKETTRLQGVGPVAIYDSLGNQFKVVKQAGYKGNPGGEDIYPNEIDHGYGEPMSGGHDVMRKLQNSYLHEQGDVVPQRPESPEVTRYSFDRAALGETAQRVAAAWLTQQEND